MLESLRTRILKCAVLTKREAVIERLFDYTGGHPMAYRFLVYRRLTRALLGKRASPLFPASPGATGCFWIHAASAGELEALVPVIDQLRAQGMGGHVSVFSRSGEKGLTRLRENWEQAPRGQLGASWSADFSPREGEWSQALREFAPRAIVTYRYEAWPDLWQSAAELGIPVTVLGAQDRPSLRWASRILSLLGGKIPRLRFALFDESERASLARRFPHADFRMVSNPRWLRAWQRVSREPSERACEVSQLLGALPRPRLMLSQIWESDLAVLPLLLWAQQKIELTVVPHALDAQQLTALERALTRAGYRIAWSKFEPAHTAPAEAATGAPSTGSPRAWIINEMGILPELYPGMDAVYVGGGFEKGVHSTIEPGVLGIPIACGPHRTERFEEIAELRRQGQLEIVKAASACEAWFSRARTQEVAARRAAWHAHWLHTQVEKVQQTDWVSAVLC